ncbi:MAG: alpha/beta hydrolase [Luteimonas sp.]|nr:alpha/beta hydrolase [Luteimonas sp.]
MRDTWKPLALLAVATALLAMPVRQARAQEAASPATAVVPPAAPGYTLPSTHTWDMTSDAGRDYRIFVSFPATEAPKDGFPVLYVLDGNASFAAFAETRRVQEYQDVGKAIVVGVGYRTDMPYSEQRNVDFIVMDDPPPGTRLGRTPGKKSGRDEFLDFLTGPLRAEIARRYRTNPRRQVLFGHSFGGLLALHALYTRPQAFAAIVAASPSLGLDDGVLRDERAFAERIRSGKLGKTSHLMVVVGGRDSDDDPYMAEAFVRRMDPLSAYGLRTRFRRYDEESHMSVPARAVTDTLRFVAESYF